MLQFFQKLLNFPPKLSLAVIYLEFDRGNNGSSEKTFKLLQGYLNNIAKCAITYLRVNNKEEGAPLFEKSKNYFTQGGDNRYREFSGWQKGLESLNELGGKNFDVILFVNDMFLAPGQSFLQDYSDISLFNKSFHENQIIGRIDSTGQPYTVYDYDVSQWVCTNCFIAPKLAVDTLGDIVSVKENLDDFLSVKYPIDLLQSHEVKGYNPHIFKEDSQINEKYKQWLVEWLTEKWHSKFILSEQTWDLFRIKVRNILNESLLTARFAEAGYQPQSYGEKKYY